MGFFLAFLEILFLPKYAAKCCKCYSYGNFTLTLFAPVYFLPGFSSFCNLESVVHRCANEFDTAKRHNRRVVQSGYRSSNTIFLGLLSTVYKLIFQPRYISYPVSWNHTARLAAFDLREDIRHLISNCNVSARRVCEMCCEHWYKESHVRYSLLTVPGYTKTQRTPHWKVFVSVRNLNFSARSFKLLSADISICIFP